ncbi:uncharacterized protein LOC127279253 isoform X2 [Leptopilina boulardi]|nr:uncharacterized protein LOC127279253 isoform X2 [Leptopilina boulardi]XP_051157450.1 uncharacterized protein LOC127279253 isoform X2 [Leptopilina boulardi]
MSKERQQRNTRSRSLTPQVLSQNLVDSETTEHHYDLRKRSRERSYTPGEVSSSRRSSSRSLQANATKNKEQNMDIINEREDELENQKEIQENINEKKPERRSERQRVKKQTVSNGQNEVKDNVANAKIECKRKSVTPKKMLTSDYSSEEGEREDPPSRPGSAYEIYKKAGEWWNVYPKTDYTYSRASQCRYEIAPGILAMPNMSRRSIHSDCSSTHGSSISNSHQSLNLETGETHSSEFADISSIKQDNMRMENASHIHHQAHTSDFSGKSSILYKRTHVEQYTSHREIVYDSNQLSPHLSPIISPEERYKSNTTFIARKYGHLSQADSDTELDEAITRTNTVNSNEKSKISNLFLKIVSIITTIFIGTLSFVTLGIFQKKEQFTASHNYQRYQESIWSRLWKVFDHIFEKVYLFLVNMMLLDSWFLSRLMKIRQYIQGRRNKIFWIALLPLLFLAGFWCLPRFFTKQTEEIVPSFYNTAKEGFIVDTSREEEMRSLLQILTDKVQRLERKDMMQTEHLKNFTQVIESLKNEKNYETINAMKVEFEALRDNYFQLKSCCDSNVQKLTDEDIESHINRVLAGYFGSSTSKEELSRVMQSLLLIRENDNIQKETVKESEVERIRGDVSLEDMRRIVKEILKIYDADKTGRVDYALESAGGQVISTRCTQGYNVKTRAYKLFGLTLYYESNDPRTVIQGNTLQPGACWAFQDFPGYLLIKLRNFIYVTGFTLEHVPKSILPNGDMRSAPRKFNVWGLKHENDLEPVMFGEYEFLDTEDNLQYFPVQNMTIKTTYDLVELRIHSNHGQLEYTCLYRFRVHGRIL